MPYFHCWTIRFFTSPEIYLLYTIISTVEVSNKLETSLILYSKPRLALLDYYQKFCEKQFPNLRILLYPKYAIISIICIFLLCFWLKIDTFKKIQVLYKFISLLCSKNVIHKEFHVVRIFISPYCICCFRQSFSW